MFFCHHICRNIKTIFYSMSDVKKVSLICKIGIPQNKLLFCDSSIAQKYIKNDNLNVKKQQTESFKFWALYCQLCPIGRLDYASNNGFVLLNRHLSPTC